MANSKIRVAIFGGSGYGGSELLRILLAHPSAEIVIVTANEHAGKPVGAVHKNLFGLTKMIFDTAPEDLSSLDVDVAFFALPHGQALSLVPQLPSKTKVIDLSGDFRLDDAGIFKEFYKLDHAGAIQSEFVYGLTETNREAIRSAHYIANPGCFATATLLALSPMVKSGLLTGKIVVDAKTGSSGSGAKPAANTHHPQRMNSFYAYKPFTHQHVPEIEQHLHQVGDFENELIFMTHSLPVSRGIFASCYLETSVNLTNEDIGNIYESFYQEAFFVRMVDGSPDINWVKTTNFCDIASYTNGKQIVVFSAIDNLVKGAAGQAVQNMNLMFGIDETTGLRMMGTNP
ncbi:MAG: N-acetyl-gamma-glutamyl-phosphate reductase [Acidobacteria bacterium]|nr:N-acetyl-gamma-glutamyl-phosphate reductase [Acidobacteriota bacterium]MBP7473927.1 N-acetyl-gamma-glutamyl-phosphate reductase [Pyrinomonadaceae bacterium]MBP9109119.1 N-acetyl-gamma-glutamyl-phosphate reductase [Pyrinomonadaceae bacterium]